VNRDLLKFLAFAVMVLLAPLYFKGGYLMNVLVFVGIHTMLAIGLNLLLGYAGQAFLRLPMPGTRGWPCLWPPCLSELWLS
jgi:branched-chain amino acid transport system permease protein